MRLFVIIILAVVILFASVDINNASVKELVTLHGVGNVKANAIVTFRKKHCFKNIGELTLVKGIGNKTLEKNRENLIVTDCK